MTAKQRDVLKTMRLLISVVIGPPFIRLIYLITQTSAPLQITDFSVPKLSNRLNNGDESVFTYATSKGRLSPYNKQQVIGLKFSVCGIVLYFNFLLVKNTPSRQLLISSVLFTNFHVICAMQIMSGTQPDTFINALLSTKIRQSVDIS